MPRLRIQNAPATPHVFKAVVHRSVFDGGERTILLFLSASQPLVL